MKLLKRTAGLLATGIWLANPGAKRKMSGKAQ